MEIKLKTIFAENDKNFDCLSFKKYSEEDFIKIARTLKDNYFAKIGDVLSEKDSVEVSINIEKLSFAFYKFQRKDIKKIKRLTRSYHTNFHLSESYQFICGIIIEPCYTLEIDEGEPLAFVVKLKYRLSNKDTNQFYRVVIL